MILRGRVQADTSQAEGTWGPETAPKNSLPYRVASGSSSKWPKIVALIKQNFQAQHCQFHSAQNDVTCYCSHIINKNILRFLFMCIIACVASVSARVRRERRDESKKKRNDGRGGGERTNFSLNNSIGNACYAGYYCAKASQGDKN